LQGTQSRHTEANLAKELALCQRTGNTLRWDTDPPPTGADMQGKDAALRICAS